MFGIHGEEDVFVGFRILGKGGNQGRFVAVADVVFAPIGTVLAVPHGRQGHVAGIQVGTVLLFRKPEGENTAVFQQPSRLLFDRLVISHPNGPQTQDAHLPGVPVGQAVETEDLIEIHIAIGTPTASLPTVWGWRQQTGKNTLLFNELEKTVIPDPLVIVLFELFSFPWSKRSRWFFA